MFFRVGQLDTPPIFQRFVIFPWDPALYPSPSLGKSLLRGTPRPLAGAPQCSTSSVIFLFFPFANQRVENCGLTSTGGMVCGMQARAPSLKHSLKSEIRIEQKYRVCLKEDIELDKLLDNEKSQLNSCSVDSPGPLQQVRNRASLFFDSLMARGTVFHQFQMSSSSAYCLPPSRLLADGCNHLHQTAHQAIWADCIDEDIYNSHGSERLISSIFSPLPSAA